MTHLLRQIASLTGADAVVTGISPDAIPGNASIAVAIFIFDCFDLHARTKLPRDGGKRGKNPSECRWKWSQARRKWQIESELHLKALGLIHLILLQRADDQPPFDTRSALIVKLLHEELGHLWERDERASAAPLPLRLKQTLTMLQGGQSEKQIALALGLSRHSVHDHVKRLHRHFGVNSRRTAGPSAGPPIASRLACLSPSANVKTTRRNNIPPGGPISYEADVVKSAGAEWMSAPLNPSTLPSDQARFCRTKPAVSPVPMPLKCTPRLK